MARRWAAGGWAVLRLDVSGIGDSPARPGEPDNFVYTPRAIDDVRAACAWLRTEIGVLPCFAVGLCSGAYHAFKAAAGGAALTGIVPVNPLVFFWKEGITLDTPTSAHAVVAEAARYRRSMLSRDKWIKLLSGRADYDLLLSVMTRDVWRRVRAGLRELRSLLGQRLEDDLGRELQMVARRGVAMHFVFSSGDPGRALLQSQGGRAYRSLHRRGLLPFDLVDDADHVFTDFDKRAALSDTVTAILESWAASPPPSSSPVPR